MSNQDRIKIGLAHPNTRNAEAFLNSWEEPFLTEEDDKDRFVFHSTISKTTVELRFFNSYEEANAFGIKHFDPVSEKRRWSINGAMLFAVSGNNADKIISLISHFAGRE